ncbi:MAG: hypothetical protein ABW056_02300 [Thermoanaerobaculia bacterium]
MVRLGVVAWTLCAAVVLLLAGTLRLTQPLFRLGAPANEGAAPDSTRLGSKSSSAASTRATPATRRTFLTAF